MVTIIRTIIGGAAVTGGGVSTLAVMDPSDEGAVQGLVDDVAAFWTSLAVGLDSNVTFQVEGNPARYAAADGSLQQVFAADGSALITGGVSGQACPRASQALIRWQTEGIANNRVIKGRTFVPGVPAAALTDAGGLSADVVTQFTGVANTLIDNLVDQLVVWSRPRPGVPGSEHRVTSASVWDQLAVLTSRRD